jgi:AbrB family looped-hinge helix DNA binding protein
MAAIDQCHFPCKNGNMSHKLNLDKAGRVVLPKPVRDRLKLRPGDALQLEAEGESITLRPIRPHAVLKKELGVWVFQGEASGDSIPDLIDTQRSKRQSEILE